jgi:hypothetical protein
VFCHFYVFFFNENLSQILANAVVKVVIPTERYHFQLLKFVCIVDASKKRYS